MARGKSKTSESNGTNAKKTSKISACAMGAERCKRPDGKISWVCCDGCEAWYHCSCVNVNPKVAADMVFHCSSCKSIKEEVKDKNTVSILTYDVFNWLIFC